MKKIVLVSMFFLTACVTSSEFNTSPIPQKEASESSTNEVSIYKSAEQLMSTNPNLALQKLNTLAQRNSNSKTYFEAMILMGKIFEQQNRPDDALKAYDRVTLSNYNHSKRVFAFYRTAAIYKNKGNLDRAVYYSKTGLNQPTVSNQDKLIFYQFAYPLFISKEDFLTALESLSFILKNSNDKQIKSEAIDIAKNIIQIRLSRTQLQTVVNTPEFVDFHGEAYAKLGELFFYSGNTEEATLQFDKALNLLPSGQLRQRIAELNKYAEFYKTVDKTSLGVIVPLSGDKKAIGESILRGLKIGMESGFGNYKLIIKDSQSDPNIASQMTNQLIRENNVFGIIGGVSTAEADSIVAITSRFGVPTIVLTPRPGIVESFDFTFQNALTLKYSALKTAETVLKNPAFNKIAILKPDDNFGNAYAETFSEAITKGGKTVTGIKSYVFTDKESLNNAIKGLVDLDMNSTRKAEYAQKVREWKKDHKNAKRAEPPKIEEILKPIIDFDALFIADSAKPATVVAATLPYFDIEKIPLIGTHLWNSDELVKRAPEQVEGSIFVDSLPPAGQWPNNFCTRSIAKSLNGKEPNLFSVIGYDTAKIFKSALGSSPGHRLALKEKLENLGKVEGCLGTLTLDQSRIVSLPTFNLIVKDQKITIQTENN